MKNFVWAWRTARRDARGSAGKALLYALSMALGMAALVAMGSFGEDLKSAVTNQTRELLGSDLNLWSRQSFEKEIEAVFEQIPGETARITGFASMAYFPAKDEVQLARIRGIEGGFPFYGELETTPADAATTYRDGPNALISRSLVTQMGAKTGDTVRIGNMDFTLAGILEKAPGETAVNSAFGPKIFVPRRYLEQTGLMQPGSMIFHWRVFKVPEGTDVDAMIEPQLDLFRKHRLGWATVQTRKEQLGEAMANLNNFLNLIACLTLLLGGLGVAGAVHYHIKQKVTQIAVLRCLGATVGQVLLVYLIQVMAMAVFAIMLGTLGGMALHFYLPVLIGDFLPFTFNPQVQPSAIAVAAIWGLLMTLLLASAPLVAIRRMSPILSFRPDLAPGGRDPAVWISYAAVAISWWLFAVARTASWLQGSIFIAALIVSILILFLTSRFLGWFARHLLSPRLPFSWRHALANLFRPHNQTSVFLIILGMGIFLVSVLGGVRAMLLDPFENTAATDRPNFVTFDIQTDQLEGVKDIVTARDLPIRAATPIVTMRLLSLKGTPVSQLFDGDIPNWSMRREYRSTWRADLAPTEELLEGEWVASVEPGISPVPVSVEKGIAETLELGIGDLFEVDILGVPLELKVTSFRRVNWQSMVPNFYLVFPEGVLEQAPANFVLTTRTGGPDQVAALQRDLVKTYPNVSSVDLTAMVRNIDELMNKVVGVIQFLAGLCIMTGFILLASAIWNSRYERLAEHALLRTLGASRRQLNQITLVEYFLLGLFASLTGLLLSLVANWGLGTFLFDVPPFPKPMELLPPVLLLPFLTLSLGYLSLRGVSNVSPSILLRES